MLRKNAVCNDQILPMGSESPPLLKIYGKSAVLARIISSSRIHDAESAALELQRVQRMHRPAGRRLLFL